MNMANLLELPPGHALHGFTPRQVPAAGAIYRATMPGDLEALFGPAEQLRDREFLLNVDGERWIAAPMPGLIVTSGDEGTMVFDAGGIIARTSGERTSIDFGLLRRAAPQ